MAVLGIAKKVRRAVRRSAAAVSARLWEEPLDERYRPAAYGGLDEAAALAAVRRQLHRLVPPASQPARLACWERSGTHPLEQLRALADEICAHRIPLFGNSYEFGPAINWHRDPVSGHQWPLSPSYRIDLWDTAGRADIRSVWELSCFRHAVVLGRACWLTQEDRYAREFVAQLWHWTEHNPLNRGANWQCPMIVAIRAANLLWAYAFLADAPSLDPRVHRLLLNLFRLHGVHIFHNLENTVPVRGNHYLADLVGLLHLSCVLPLMSQAPRWFAFARAELDREVRTQVFPDGVSFEASVPYHGLVAEMLLHAVILPARLGSPAVPIEAAGLPSLSLLQRSRQLLGDGLVNSVERMLEVVACYTKPDGSAPQIGDNDSSRWVAFSDKPASENDHRHLLAVGGEFFDRDDFRQVGLPACEEALWLLEGEPRCPSGPACPPRSHLFEHAGLCIMRSGKDWLITRCGPLGTAGKGTHNHNDNLSFELCVGGATYLLDPGTYTYLRHPELRSLFRSTAYHNTVRIDGLEQYESSPQDPFRLLPASEASILKWESSDDQDLLQGRVRWGLPSGGNVVHQREFHFAKAAPRWTITDEISGSGTHTLEWFFHLAPGVRLEPNGREIVLRSGSQAAIRLGGDLLDQGTLEVRESWFSPGYDQRVPSHVICLFRRALLPLRTRWVIEALQTHAAGTLCARPGPFVGRAAGDPVPDPA